MEPRSHDQWGSPITLIRWSVVLAGLLALILVPFLLFESQLTAWTTQALDGRSPAVLAAIIAGGLASDLLLPVPSSVLSTMAGHELGFVPGTLTSWLGMTIGCLLGYSLGRWGGQPLILRLVGHAQLDGE